MNAQEFIKALRSQMEPSTGCTDPGSVSLAVANAVTALGRQPETISVVVSANVYKNAVSVGIPGTFKSGMELAAALGAIVNRPEKGLAILADVSDEAIRQAEEAVRGGSIHVTYTETAPDPLYVKAEVTAGEDSAAAIIMYDYSNVAELTRNGQCLKKSEAQSEEAKYPFMHCTVRELYDLILEMDWRELEFLLESAEMNRAAALKGLADSHASLGPLLKARSTQADGIFNITNQIQSYTAAAGEARMLGMDVTIMTIAGSGNHGITNFLGVLTAAESIGATREQTVRALAISSMITVYIKTYVKRMTAFCGCGVAASTGVAAAVVYLLGGSFQQSVNAMQSVIGTIGGMFCDGAKESCAYKLSTAVSAAVQFAYLAMQGCSIPASVGIIGPTIEDTFKNMGRLNNPGMVETDRLLVSIVQENAQSKLKQEPC